MDGLYEQVRIAIHSVWTRRWLALAVAWGICIAGWVVLAAIPNSYEAKAKIYVEAPGMLPSAIASAPIDRKNDLVKLQQTLLSTDNLERVVRRTELNDKVSDDRDLAVQVAALRESIKVTAQLDNGFEITATSSVAGFSNAQNARTSAAVVQALIDSFVEGSLAGSRAETDQTLTFLNEELGRRETALREAEQRRAEFESRFMGMLPGEGSVAQRVSAARIELGSIDQQLIAAQGGVAAARGQLAATPATIIGAGGEGGGGAGAQIAALEGQIAMLRARGFTDGHPDVASARAQIARLRPQANAERRSGVAAGANNPLYITLRSMLAEKEAQVAALMTRKRQLESGLGQLNAMQTADPQVMAEQARLNSDYEVLKKQYDKLLDDREQIRLRGDVNSKTDPLKVRVVERPSVPNAPATPNRPLLLTLILLVAVAGGAGAAFVMAQLRLTFPTQGRLEEVTGLPVLGAVTEFVTVPARAFEHQRLRRFAAAGGALGAAYALLLAVEFYQRSMIA